MTSAPLNCTLHVNEEELKLAGRWMAHYAKPLQYVVSPVKGYTLIATDPVHIASIKSYIIRNG